MKYNTLLYLFAILFSNVDFARAQSSPISSQHSDHTTTNYFISPIVPIPLKQAIAPPTVAQATQRMLWYKGKKINDSILITPENTLVLYSKKRDMVVVQPDKKKDPSISQIKEMERTAEKKQKVFRELAKYKVNAMWYPAVINSLNEYDIILKSMENTLKNTIVLPSSLTPTASLRSLGSYANNSEIIIGGFIPDEVKRVYNEVMGLMKNYPSIEFISPPADELSACAKCHITEEEKKKKANETVKWRDEEFWPYEMKIIQKSLAVLRSITDLKAVDAEANKIGAELLKALEFATNRLRNKVDILIKEHGKDMTRLSSVVQTSLAVERQKQLLGVGEDTYAATMTKLLALFENFDAYLQKQIDEKNYDFVLNIPFIIGIERQRQLLGSSDDRSPDYIQKISDFNRFRIDLQMEFEGEYPGCGGSSSTEKMISRNKMDYHVSLALVNCKYQFVASEEVIKNVKNYHFAQRYFLVQDITSGIHVSKWEDDNERCQTTTYNYTGLEIRPRAPIASFTFCEDEQDSLQFYDLHLAYSREDRKGARVFEFTNLLYLDDMSNTGEIPQRIMDASVELDETKALLSQYEMGVHPDTLSESAMKNMYELTTKREELLRILNEFEDTKKRSLMLFDAKNRNETLIDEQITIPYLHEGTADVKYTLKLKVTHNPLGSK